MSRVAPFCLPALNCFFHPLRRINFECLVLLLLFCSFHFKKSPSFPNPFPKTALPYCSFLLLLFLLFLLFLLLLLLLPLLTLIIVASVLLLLTYTHTRDGLGGKKCEEKERDGENKGKVYCSDPLLFPL